jgi:predicted amidohydrolase YtcJ
MKSKHIIASVVLAGIFAALSSCGDRETEVVNQTDDRNDIVDNGTPGPAGSADFVLTNGKVYTVDEAQPWAEAVAVSGNEIVYVGDNDGASAFVGEGTESIDLGGRLLLPGFVESHIHLGGGAGTSSGLILSTEDSIEEVLKKVKDYADANPDLPTIFGASYLSTLFGPEGPTKEVLDEMIPDRAVFLMDQTLHSVWVNSKAYEVAGITTETPAPPGGEYVKNDQGELSGTIRGVPAHLPVLEANKAISVDGLMKVLPDVFEGLSEFGFTTAIDMGMPFAAEAAYDAFVSLDEKGELPIRLSVTYYVNTPSLADGAVEMLEKYSKKYKTEHVWFDTLKITGDSVVENQKAAFIEPYLTSGDNGSLYFDKEALLEMVMPAAEKGFNITIHTIGDLATRTALDAAEAIREAGHHDTLFSTTHSQMVHPDDRPRYKELNVTAQSTGNWAVLLPSYVELLGQERVDTLQFPFRTWADGGVNIALGADWPATPGGFENGVHPFNNIYSAMHRKAPKEAQAALGTIDEALKPYDETLTLEECIEAYTMGGARMLGIADEIGSIEVGKKADLILLDQNLFEIDAEAIPKTKVLGTMFDGRIVHDVLYDLGDSELVDYENIAPGAIGPCCRKCLPVDAKALLRKGGQSGQ